MLAVYFWVRQQVTVDRLVLARVVDEAAVARRLVVPLLAARLDHDELDVFVAVALHDRPGHKLLPNGAIEPKGDKALLPNAVRRDANVALLFKERVQLLSLRQDRLCVSRVHGHHYLRHRVVSHVDQLDALVAVALHALEAKLGGRCALLWRLALRARRRRGHLLEREQRGGGLVGGSLHQARPSSKKRDINFFQVSSRL
eukprot:1843519-Prymnesium_polylepis.1